MDIIDILTNLLTIVIALIMAFAVAYWVTGLLIDMALAIKARRETRRRMKAEPRTHGQEGGHPVPGP